MMIREVTQLWIANLKFVTGAVFAGALCVSQLSQAASLQTGSTNRHRSSAAATHSAVALRDPSLRSAAALVWDEDSGHAVYSHHADAAGPIASISKLMTSLVVLEAQQSMGEVLEIAPEDDQLPKPNVSRLKIGTQLTRSDLLHLALMASENRAANALARYYPGGWRACIAAMNAKAAALGMTQTHFVEPTGLSSSNVASPQDLVLLVKAASQVQIIQEDSTAPEYIVEVQGELMSFRTTDHLVASPDWDIVVQKTGFIGEAGRCLVMKAIVDGRAFEIVLLNSQGTKTRLADAQRVRHWLEARDRLGAPETELATAKRTGSSPANGLDKPIQNGL